MKLRKEVHTGEVKFGDEKAYLRSVGIGSCVVVIADASEHVFGGMAHVMLPGSARENRKDRLGRYARPAISRLLGELSDAGIEPEDLNVVLAGGANVLDKPGKKVGEENIISIRKILRENNLTVSAKSLGGKKRRRVIYDVEAGKIYCAIGSGEEKLLWSRRTSDSQKLFQSDH